ncbi:MULTISPECIES: PQQ-dependent sugar dehydrogenase [Spirosoma]|uniref:Sorbosone dehydrogenase family protein n=1 Tax=Spirosoma liriopis TaxID=2937440 RepID=A0ABT0HQX4_9BACT|nr:MULTISPECIES: sorbosone dehydrogenase family protein [Spirosoma]MCK8494380.1 sorbosone dehydrogenase family protein [Spirosoma liriopis]UHG89391.1 sorbosone dehydrogenase family protein [Spirosoma oryzicola]
MKTLIVTTVAMTALFAACNSKKESNTAATDVATADTTITLPAPYATKSTQHFSNVIGWPQGKTPQAPAGFAVTEYVSGLASPRWIYVAPNGDIFVAEANTERKGVKQAIKNIAVGQSNSERSAPSANRITLLRDTNKDGKPEVKETFLGGLNQPFGMLVLGDHFYVANTDGIWQYPYKAGQSKMSSPGKKILNLPAGGYNNHWTRNLLASPDGKKIYVSVGSGSNVGEHGMDNEVRRANILEINPDGSGERIFASGLRNPVGMDWQPENKTLYTAVNERDELGDELVPDYLTSVKEGAFYGWPYSYYGQNEDPRRKGERPDLVKKTVVPDVPLGSHTASLGLAFYDETAFPEKYRNGAFVGQHGSWNRSTFSGYKVVFVPFANGKPGKPEDFLTGFITAGNDKDVYGRPVGVTVAPDGALLVADDAAGRIWRVVASK